MNDAILVLIGTLLGATIGALGAGGFSYLNWKLHADHAREEATRARRAELRRDSVHQVKRALGEILYMARPMVGDSDWPSDLVSNKMGSRQELIDKWERSKGAWRWDKRRVEELQREAGISLAMLASDSIANAAAEFWAALAMYKIAQSIIEELIDPSIADQETQTDWDALDKALKDKSEAIGFLDRAQSELMNGLDDLVAQ